MKIENRMIGGGAPALLVAEIAQAHDGSLGTAHAYIDAVADAGANAVKFQTHLALHESTLDEPFRVRFSRQDATRYAYWQRMEFTRPQWEGLMRHARERGLLFLSSVFCLPALDMLNALGIAAWKLPAGEFRSADLLDAMAATGKPVLISTGMSTRADIAFAVERVACRNTPYALLQTTSRYPVPLEEVGLNVPFELRDRYGCPVGLSDHSGSVFPGLAALARGIDILEVHVVFDRRQFGPDVSASVTLDALRTLAQARDAFDVMARNPVAKDAMAAELDTMRKTFSKSLAPRTALKAGTVLADGDLVGKKPGTGIPVERKAECVGRTLARDVAPDHLLRPEDLNPEPRTLKPETPPRVNQ
jgi:N,N'-diacetyllegionaminate synthase